MPARLFALAFSSASLIVHPALALDPVGAVGSTVEGAAGTVDGVTNGSGGSVGATVEGSVGGVGAAANVEAGSGGISAGGGVSIGSGIGEAPAGGGTGQSGSAGTRTGSTANIGSGRSPPQGAAGGPLGDPAFAADDNEAIAQLTLPPRLLPVSDPGGGAALQGPGPDTTGSVRLSPLVPRPGTSAQVIGACREAIASAAAPYGAARVEVVGAGRSTRIRGGGIAAPVEARIVYSRGGRLQVRQAQISCRLSASGNVVAAL